jgi:phytoene dehydrogenase-like protein
MLNKDKKNQSKTSNKPRVIIIGGGIAGLSTGCYLQMNGFATQIFERHVLPGGCCTAWSRKDYIFDYCIDWLVGSNHGIANQVWRELGALDGKTIKNFELFNRVVDQEGNEVIFYNAPDRLEKHLLQISPKDEKLIKSFCHDLKHFTRIDIFQPLKPQPLMGYYERFQEIIKMVPHILLFMRTGGKQMADFANGLTNPLLKRAMNNIFFQDPKTFPLLPYLYNMACAHNNNAGFPQGGSLGLSCSIEERYLSLGGIIHYGSAVTKILLKNNRAIGIELKKGPPKFSDYIISASDGYTTIYELLDGKFTNKLITKLYKNLLLKQNILFPSVISIFIGFKGQVGQNDPHSTTFLLTPHDAAKLPACSQNSLVLQHRSRYADGFAPAGHSIIHCTYFSDFDYWNNLRLLDKSAYRLKKSEIIIFIKNFLEKIYPGIKENIEVMEVATPATTKRYTGNFKGSIFGFKAFSEAEDLATCLVNKHRMQLPGLNNFYMTGQWVLGGGLPRSAMSGRYVAQFLCDDLQLPFKVFENKTKTRWKNKLKNLPQLDEPSMF